MHIPFLSQNGRGRGESKTDNDKHRFIQATWLALGNKAVDVASDLIYAGTPKIDGAMIEVLGEPLRDF